MVILEGVILVFVTKLFVFVEKHTKQGYYLLVYIAFINFISLLLDYLIYIENKKLKCDFLISELKFKGWVEINRISLNHL